MLKQLFGLSVLNLFLYLATMFLLVLFLAVAMRWAVSLDIAVTSWFRQVLNNFAGWVGA
jgi:hypothetical protein